MFVCEKQEDKYIKAEDSDKITYYKSCECGEKGEETFEVLKEKEDTVEIEYIPNEGDALQGLITIKTSEGKSLVLESSNEKVVKVENDQFVIVGYGKVTLEATYGNAKTQIEIEVKQNITLDVTCTGEVKTGEKVDLNITINYGDYLVTTSNDGILKVENNEVIALEAGKATITVTSTLDPSIKKSIEITVVKDNNEEVAKEMLNGIVFPKEGYEDLPQSTNDYTLTYQMDKGIDANGKITREDEDTVSTGKVVLTYKGVNVEKEITYNIWGSFTDSVIAEFLANLPAKITDSVKFLGKSDSYGGTRIIINDIDKPEYLDKKGLYNQPFHDELVTIKLNIRTTEPSTSRYFYVTVNVGGKPIKEKAALVMKWIFNEVPENSVLYYDSPALPNACDDYDATIEWFDAKGNLLDFSKIAQDPVLGDSQALAPKITIRGESCIENADYYVWNKHYQSEEEKITDFVNAINWQNIRAYKYWNAQRTGNNYGYIPFYTPGEAERNLEYMAEYTYGRVRTGILKTSTEYIVIHDTAGSEKTHTAESFAQSIISQNNNPNNSYISWHFSVGNDGIYQSLLLLLLFLLLPL